MLQAALEDARGQQERYLNELLDLLRIPSISTLTEHRADMIRAADWLADHLRMIGMDNIEVLPTKGHPVVYADRLSAGVDRPTLLIYGHYDVQPPDPLDEWHSPPFEPVVRDGQIYARGATDDKGQLFAHLKAIESVLRSEGGLPINVKLMYEGEEELGSPNIDDFVRVNKSRLQADSVLISDTSMLSENQPMVIYGLRGLAYMEVHATGPAHDLHSGAFGGTVYNPAQWLGEVIAALHDDSGRVAIPGFYDNVRPLSEEERSIMATVPFEIEAWQNETGLANPVGEEGYTPSERIGARPTCEVNGIWGGFQGEGSKTIIPASAGAKISMRLVPDQNPDEVAQLFTDFVIGKAVSGIRVEVRKLVGGRPAIVPLDSPAIRAATKACEAVWGVAPVYRRGGGSISVVATFQKELGIPTALIGFGLPGEMLHAPNEHFSVSQFYKGIEATIHYLYLLAGETS